MGPEVVGDNTLEPDKTIKGEAVALVLWAWIPGGGLCEGFLLVYMAFWGPFLPRRASHVSVRDYVQHCLHSQLPGLSALHLPGCFA